MGEGAEELVFGYLGGRGEGIRLRLGAVVEDTVESAGSRAVADDVLDGATGGDDFLTLGAALLAVEEAVIAGVELAAAAPIAVEAAAGRLGLPHRG